MHLRLEPDIAIVASVHNRQQLQESLQEAVDTVDVVIADCDLPDLALPALQDLKKNHPKLKILALTDAKDKALRQRRCLSELDAVLEKTGKSQCIIETIRQLKQGLIH